MYGCILFDLDGTLTDPWEGITRSVQYALRAMGVEVSDRRELTRFIGPPLRQSFGAFYGLSPARAEEAVARYREYFADKGIFENAVYPGIPALLAALGECGATLLLATSKPTVYAARILAHFALEGFFSGVYGSELDGTRSDKAEVIALALKEGGVDPRRAVMVGDREHDIVGAAKNGMASVGVLYGYGDRAELEAVGAGRIAATVDELQTLLLS